jgi:aspartate aminotransferase-like enzyme
LIKAQEISETLATPHRLFDVDSVKEALKEEDPLVVMQLVFVECANTGVRSPLERFIGVLIDGKGEPTSVTLAVDLIEGLADLAPTDDAIGIHALNDVEQSSDIEGD